MDLALISHTLHHAEHPAEAVAEAVRVLAPGGTLLILDLDAHEETWVENELGDRWLGFDEKELKKLLRSAGLCQVRVSVGAKRRGDPFTVLIASGRKGK